MDAIQLSSFLLLGITGGILQYKRLYRFLPFLHLLFFLATGLVISSDLDATGQNFLFAIISVASINFVAANLLPARFRRRFVRLLVPTLTMIAFFFLTNGHTIVVQGTKLISSNYILLAGVAIALFSVDLGELKIKGFNKLLGGMDHEKLISIFVIFAVAVALFLGLFSSLTFGAYLIAGAYLSTSFYRQEDDKYPVVSLLLITFVISMSVNLELSDLSLLKPKLIAGLLIGVFGHEFIRLLITSKNRTIASTFTSYLVFGILVFALFFLGSKLASLGGYDAYLSVLIGVALANMVSGKAYVALSIGSLLIAGIGFMSLQEEDNQVSNSEIERNELTEEDNPGDKYLSLEDVIGKFKVIPESSRVDFVLGPNKETSGAFEKVEGQIEFKEELDKSAFDITLSLADFTTFDEFRDESLMDETYFNASEFPTMTFSSERIEVDGDSYYINGTFNMLGVKRLVKISLNRLDVVDKLILKGSGSLDRTEFGMDPSAAEGNIVDFTYSVELKEID
jgi:polyisoprenoid-binding protein YceI